MVKNILFSLLICNIYLVSVSSLAGSETALLEKSTLNSPNCDAPAPDSFRITTFGDDFVTLTWKPAWPGATHTLVVVRKIDGTGAWMPVDTIYNVPEASYVVSNKEYDLSRSGFMISTNCAYGISGDPTAVVELELPPIGLILELTIAGRNPIKPEDIEPCTPITIATHNWFGFSVSDGLNIVANTFEVGVHNSADGHKYPVVKRVNEPPLVAGNQDFLYPQASQNSSIFFLGDPPAIFRVFLANSNGTFTPIGYVRIIISGTGQDQSITICRLTSQPWNNIFGFKVLSSSVADESHPQVNENRFVIPPTSSENIKVQTPIIDNLNVFLPESYSEKKQITFSLWDATGHQVLEKHFENTSEKISIPVETLSIGYYFLRIVSDRETRTFKIFKVE